jgi:hypothetical protein
MAPDTSFLTRAIDILQALRERSLERGHPMLASLVEMARIEAEDDLRTATHVDELWAPFFAEGKGNQGTGGPPPSA